MPGDAFESAKLDEFRLVQLIEGLLKVYRNHQCVTCAASAPLMFPRYGSSFMDVVVVALGVVAFTIG